MKLLIISSSPRKEGNSARLCLELERGAKEAGHEVVTLHIAPMKIQPCRGCEYCRSHNHQCVQKDDMAVILSELSKADIVAVATPVYFYNVSAQLKLFFDRTYCCYKELPFRKTVFLAATHSKAENAFDTPVAAYKGWVRCLKDTESIAEITAGGVFGAGEIEGHPALLKAYELGKNI